VIVAAEAAPRVVLRATHEAAQDYCVLAELKRVAVDLAEGATLPNQPERSCRAVLVPIH
jgi:hypothetical protein